MELKIKYIGERDEYLDHKIEQIADSLGFREWARGYSIDNKERDFAFDKKEKGE